MATTQEIVQEVLTQIQNSGINISNAEVVSDKSALESLVGLDSNKEVKRITLTSLNEQEENNARAISDEITRAQEEEKTLQSDINAETTRATQAEENLQEQISANSLDVDTLQLQTLGFTTTLKGAVQTKIPTIKYGENLTIKFVATNNENINYYMYAIDVDGNTFELGAISVGKSITTTAKADLNAIRIWGQGIGDTDRNEILITSTDITLQNKIDDIAPKEITWNSNASLAQWTFRFAGIYDIKGERTNKNDGFPIDNAASGHTINARLIVLDSSLPQASNTPQEDDACITQILMLSNRTGGEGNIYIRSARGHIDRSKWPVNGSNFTPWMKLQGNMEVGLVGYGQAKTLDDFIDNGMYSGVNAISASANETFLMIVINDYAVTVNRSISQFKYALVAGANTVTYQTRVRQVGSETWTEWKNLNEADDVLSTTSSNPVKNKVVTEALVSETTRATQAEQALQTNLSTEISRATEAENELQTNIDSVNTELLKRIKGTSSSSDSQTDPFKYMGGFSTTAEMVATLDKWHASTSADFSKYNGFFRAKVEVSYFEITNACLSIASDIWVQSINGNLYLKSDGTLSMSNKDSGTFVRYHNSDGWSSWTIANKSEIDTLISNEIAKEVARATEQEAELLKRIQGTSDKSLSSTDSFKYIGRVTIASVREYLDNLYTTSWDEVESKIGFYRARVDYRFLTIESSLFAMSGQSWGQKVSGFIEINLSNKQEFYLANKYNTIYRVHSTDGWSDWSYIS